LINYYETPVPRLPIVGSIKPWWVIAEYRHLGSSSMQESLNIMDIECASVTAESESFIDVSFTTAADLKRRTARIMPLTRREEEKAAGTGFVTFLRQSAAGKQA